MSRFSLIIPMRSLYTIMATKGSKVCGGRKYYGWGREGMAACTITSVCLSLWLDWALLSQDRPQGCFSGGLALWLGAYKFTL